MEGLRTSATLIVPIFGTCALLGKRRVQPFKGTLSGYGGRLHSGERVLAAAVREWKEETGTTLREEDLMWFGIMDTHRRIGGEWQDFRVHLYWTTKWEGKFVTTKEMTEPIPIELRGRSQHPLRSEIELLLSHLARRDRRRIHIVANDRPDGTTNIRSYII